MPKSLILLSYLLAAAMFAGCSTSDRHAELTEQLEQAKASGLGPKHPRRIQIERELAELEPR